MRAGRVKTHDEQSSGDSFLPPPGHAYWRQRDVAEQTLKAIRVLEEDRERLLAEIDSSKDLHKSIEWLQNNNRRLKAALSAEQKRASQLEQRFATGNLGFGDRGGNLRPSSATPSAVTPEPQYRPVLPHPTGWEASYSRHEPQSPARSSRASTPPPMPLSPSGRHASHGAASGALAALLQHPQYAASIADSEHSRGEGSAGGTFADRESHWHDQLALANAQLTAERTRAADAESLLIQQLRASTSAREEALERIAEKDAEIQRLTDGLSEVARVRRAFDELASTHENQMARVEQHAELRNGEVALRGEIRDLKAERAALLDARVQRDREIDELRLRCSQLERVIEDERASLREVQRLREAALRQLRATQAEAHEIQQRFASTEKEAGEAAAQYMQSRAEQAACIARLEDELRRLREQQQRPRSPFDPISRSSTPTVGIADGPSSSGRGWAAHTPATGPERAATPPDFGPQADRPGSRWSQRRATYDAQQSQHAQQQRERDRRRDEPRPDSALSDASANGTDGADSAGSRPSSRADAHGADYHANATSRGAGPSPRVQSASGCAGDAGVAAQPQGGPAALLQAASANAPRTQSPLPMPGVAAPAHSAGGTAEAAAAGRVQGGAGGGIGSGADDFGQQAREWSGPESGPGERDPATKKAAIAQPVAGSSAHGAASQAATKGNNPPADGTVPPLVDAAAWHQPFPGIAGFGASGAPSGRDWDALLAGTGSPSTPIPAAALIPVAGGLNSSSQWEGSQPRPQSSASDPPREKTVLEAIEQSGGEVWSWDSFAATATATGQGQEGGGDWQRVREQEEAQRAASLYCAPAQRAEADGAAPPERPWPLQGQRTPPPEAAGMRETRPLSLREHAAPERPLPGERTSNGAHPSSPRAAPASASAIAEQLPPGSPSASSRASRLGDGGDGSGGGGGGGSVAAELAQQRAEQRAGWRSERLAIQEERERRLGEQEKRLQELLAMASADWGDIPAPALADEAPDSPVRKLAGAEPGAGPRPEVKRACTETVQRALAPAQAPEDRSRLPFGAGQNGPGATAGAAAGAGASNAQAAAAGTLSRFQARQRELRGGGASAAEAGGAAQLSSGPQDATRPDSNGHGHAPWTHRHDGSVPQGNGEQSGSPRATAANGAGNAATRQSLPLSTLPTPSDAWSPPARDSPASPKSPKSPRAAASVAATAAAGRYGVANNAFVAQPRDYFLGNGTAATRPHQQQRPSPSVAATAESAAESSAPVERQRSFDFSPSGERIHERSALEAQESGGGRGESTGREAPAAAIPAAPAAGPTSPSSGVSYQGANPHLASIFATAPVPAYAPAPQHQPQYQPQQGASRHQAPAEEFRTRPAADAEQERRRMAQRQLFHGGVVSPGPAQYQQQQQQQQGDRLLPTVTAPSPAALPPSLSPSERAPSTTHPQEQPSPPPPPPSPSPLDPVGEPSPQALSPLTREASLDGYLERTGAAQPGGGRGPSEGVPPVASSSLLSAEAPAPVVLAAAATAAPAAPLAAPPASAAAAVAAPRFRLSEARVDPAAAAAGMRFDFGSSGPIAEGEPRGAWVPSAAGAGRATPPSPFSGSEPDEDSSGHPQPVRHLAQQPPHSGSTRTQPQAPAAAREPDEPEDFPPGGASLRQLERAAAAATAAASAATSAGPGRSQPSSDGGGIAGAIAGALAGIASGLAAVSGSGASSASSLPGSPQGPPSGGRPLSRSSSRSSLGSAGSFKRTRSLSKGLAAPGGSQGDLDHAGAEAPQFVDAFGGVSSPVRGSGGQPSEEEDQRVRAAAAASSSPGAGSGGGAYASGLPRSPLSPAAARDVFAMSPAARTAALLIEQEQQGVNEVGLRGSAVALAAVTAK